MSDHSHVYYGEGYHMNLNVITDLIMHALLVSCYRLALSAEIVKKSTIYWEKLPCDSCQCFLFHIIVNIFLTTK